MTRHARNCTAGAVYTYHEKRKDAAAGGYGTRAERLVKHSLNNFDCCSLTLQPCRNPVVSEDGYLFDKEAILEYIVAKKVEYGKKLKQYEKQLMRDEAESGEAAEAKKRAQLVKFVDGERSIARAGSSRASATSSSVSNLAVGDAKQLPSFWVPSQLPDAHRSRCVKPDPTVYCPVSGKPLKARNLVPVKWTPMRDDGAGKSLIAKECRYMCPVTHDALGNSVPCAVIRTSGDVVTMECVERVIRPTWTHPLTGERLRERDVIALQRGGTGFAATNSSLEGCDKRPALQA